MNIYPAIDLRNGKCIRLIQGDFNQETIYHNDPFAVVKTFLAEGADWFHIIDLDGAKNPEKNQLELITKLIDVSGIKVQAGGGIRTKEQVMNLIEHGVERVIVGSMAITNMDEVTDWFTYFGPEYLVLALDVKINKEKQPMVAINAWQDEGEYSIYEVIEFYQTMGLEHVLCTNISRDGMLQGPDFNLYATLLTQFPFLKLQASGGIQSLEDISLLRQQNLDGAVIGRALYENKFSLQEVLTC